MPETNGWGISCDELAIKNGEYGMFTQCIDEGRWIIRP